MFALEEIKEYWCVVSVNDDKDDVRVLRVSEDITKDEALDFSNGIPFDDTMIDVDWFDEWIDEETTVAGVHKLTLEPVYEDLEEDAGTTPSAEDAKVEKCFEHFNVTKVDVLYTLLTD